jgi:hypothetical protein
MIENESETNAYLRIREAMSQIVMAEAVLVGGPGGEEIAGFIPADTAAPIQIVWTSWYPQGQAAYLYEWHGETRTVGGVTAALIYHCTGRLFTPDDIPPAIAEMAQVWNDGALLLIQGLDLPPELIWHGL